MTQPELIQKLQELLTQTEESEVFEHKEAKNDFDFRRLGKYFSALSNEANLRGVSEAWLVFGVRDHDCAIVGSQYKSQPNLLNKLKADIATQTTHHITFKEIYTLNLPEGRVILFQIPAAPTGLPVAWEGHYYGRDGEALVPLNIEELERIRRQSIAEDWSAQTCPSASLNDLDPLALAKARENYHRKYPERTDEIAAWDDQTFLNKAKITIKGKITRAAIVLLGRPESEHFINPAEAKIRWILRNSRGEDMDYLLESCPLLLAVDKIYAKIRNTTYRYLKGESLFPEEVLRYDPFLLREAINNCIAHQDYVIGGRINVIELEDQLVFSNKGSFLPGSIERVVIENAPEEYYRNQFLVTAMYNLGMVDTIGGGIRKMFLAQSKRFFPMPEYDIESNRVIMTVTGKVLDMDFAQVLIRNPELTLEEIILLDKIQKHQPLTAEALKHLRKRKLIEGRKPNFFISAKVAQAIGQKAVYSKTKGLDKQYYLELILESIRQHQFMERTDLDTLLWHKLPEWMNDEQRKNKITNLLAELRRTGKIQNQGTFAKPRWILTS